MNDADITTWVTIVGNFGFPIFLTGYLLMRFEKKLDRLTSAILDLQELIKGEATKK